MKIKIELNLNSIKLKLTLKKRYVTDQNFSLQLVLKPYEILL